MIQEKVKALIAVGKAYRPKKADSKFLLNLLWLGREIKREDVEMVKKIVSRK